MRQTEFTLVSDERLENQRSAITMGVVRHAVNKSAGNSGDTVTPYIIKKISNEIMMKKEWRRWVTRKDFGRATRSQ
jgi:hypothetical protein